MEQLVSIIIPIYGVEKYIERCAVSLFEQTYTKIEYIFVNDCTPDKSIEKLNEVLKKISGSQSKRECCGEYYELRPSRSS